MTIATSPTLPADHGRTTNRHEDVAAAMRNTDDWVHVGDYRTRQTARNVAYQVRNGHWTAYANRRYHTEVITTKDGVHQVWGRYAGERGPRR